MQPHNLDPFLVTNQDVPAKHQRFGQSWFDGLSVSELLAEPGIREKEWMSCVAARLAVASTGPLCSGLEGAPLRRLESAGWLNVAPDADLNAARAAAWPALDRVREINIGAGSLAPKVVLVGERDPYGRLPFFARAGTWLFRALRELGWDELNCYATNAWSPRRRSYAKKLPQLAEEFARYDPTWVACGNVAHDALAAAGIEHISVPHPAGERRFNFKAGPEGFAAKLEAAGLPRGPGGIYTVSPPSLALPERLGLPRTTAFMRTDDGNQSVHRGVGVDPLLAEKARTLFVTGAEPTAKAAAERVGVKPGPLVRLSKHQNWEIERTEYLRTVRERAKDVGATAEAAKVASARSMAWSTAVKTLELLGTQLSEEGARVRPQDVKVLVDAAISLKDLGDARVEGEAARLAALGPRELLKELQTTVDGMFGFGEEKKA